MGCKQLEKPFISIDSSFCFWFIPIEIKIPYMFVQSPEWIVFVSGKVWIICHVVVNDLDIWITCARRRSKIEGHNDCETYPHRINAKILCTFRMYFEHLMCTALYFIFTATSHKTPIQNRNIKKWAIQVTSVKWFLELTNKNQAKNYWLMQQWKSCKFLLLLTCSTTKITLDWVNEN